MLACHLKRCDASVTKSLMPAQHAHHVMLWHLRKFVAADHVKAFARAEYHRDMYWVYALSHIATSSAYPSPGWLTINS